MEAKETTQQVARRGTRRWRWQWRSGSDNIIFVWYMEEKMSIVGLVETGKITKRFIIQERFALALVILLF